MKASIIKSSAKDSERIRRVEITINETRYHISESSDGKLTINKPDLDDKAIAIYPRYGNEIDIN